MAMSKRHFEKLASILRGEAECIDIEERDAQANGTTEPLAALEGRRYTLARLRLDIAQMCREENSRFDTGRFIDACNPSKE